ncbi:MAG: hypothetical protein RR594_03620 [Clostridia bacterium]
MNNYTNDLQHVYVQILGEILGVTPDSLMLLVKKDDFANRLSQVDILTNKDVNIPNDLYSFMKLLSKALLGRNVDQQLSEITALELYKIRRYNKIELITTERNNLDILEEAKDFKKYMTNYYSHEFEKLSPKISFKEAAYNSYLEFFSNATEISIDSCKKLVELNPAANEILNNTDEFLTSNYIKNSENILKCFIKRDDWDELNFLNSDEISEIENRYGIYVKNIKSPFSHVAFNNFYAPHGYNYLMCYLSHHRLIEY